MIDIEQIKNCIFCSRELKSMSDADWDLHMGCPNRKKHKPNVMWIAPWNHSKYLNIRLGKNQLHWNFFSKRTELICYLDENSWDDFHSTVFSVDYLLDVELTPSVLQNKINTILTML